MQELNVLQYESLQSNDAKCKANTVPPAAIPAPPSQSIFAFPGKQHHCWKTNTFRLSLPCKLQHFAKIVIWLSQSELEIMHTNKHDSGNLISLFI